MNVLDDPVACVVVGPVALRLMSLEDRHAVAAELCVDEPRRSPLECHREAASEAMLDADLDDAVDRSAVVTACTAIVASDLRKSVDQRAKLSAEAQTLKQKVRRQSKTIGTLNQRIVALQSNNNPLLVPLDPAKRY